MAVCFDRIFGEAFFNDEVMEKLIEELFHLSVLFQSPCHSCGSRNPGKIPNEEITGYPLSRV
jgi:hypothetical protein